MAEYPQLNQALARAGVLAKRRDTPVLIVWSGEGYALADEDDLDTWWLGARVIGEVMSDGTYVPAD